MQYNGQEKASPSQAEGYSTHSGPPAASKEAHARFASQGGPMPPSFPSSSGEPRSRMSAGDKHALAGGLFVMLSLAVAMGVGWWVTPPSPPSMSAVNQSSLRAAPLTRSEEGNEVIESSGGAAAASSPEANRTVPTLNPNAFKLNPPAQPEPEVEIASPVQAASEEQPSLGQSAHAIEATDNTKPPAKRSTAREEETQRLKAHADSETQKDKPGKHEQASKTPAKSKHSNSRPASARKASKQSDLRHAVAQCSNKKGLFFQERCKWKLCNGRWGKDGCPSYRKDKRDFH